LSELDCIEGVLESILSEKIGLMVLVFRFIEELIHLPLISFNVELVSSQNNQPDPEPHNAKDSLVKLLFWSIVCKLSPEIIWLSPIIIIQDFEKETEGICKFVRT
jgi:hypothetical protein